MNIDFRQTGDPWHDWGLCELYDVLVNRCQQNGDISVSKPDESGFTVMSDLTPEQFGRIVGAQLSANDRWDALHPRFEEGKKIARCKPSTEQGRRVPGEKYDPKVSKSEWEAAECHGTLPTVARNRCQRLASVPMTPAKLSELLRPDGGKESIGHIAADAARGVGADVTQSANPVAGKHHSNGKVRGPSGNNGARLETAAFLLACFCASVSAWKPFVKDDDCIVYFPDNLPFPRALELRTQLMSGALVHPDAPSGEMRRNLPLRGDGEEANLLILLDSLQSRLAFRKEGDGLFSADELIPNNWLAIHFSSGTNVSVGGIHRIEVPGFVFPLLKPVPPPSHWKSDEEVSFIADCLTGVRVETLPVQSRIAHALFLGNRRDAWRSLATTAFFLYKNVDQAGKSTRSAVRLLPHFFSHFAKELLTMTEDQLTACRKIGALAGRAFSTDVTLISRLHNAASADDFRATLNVLGFRLFKVSNADEKEKKERELYGGIKTDEFITVLDMASPTDWQAAAQTVSIFASLTAFNKNLNKDKDDKGSQK